MGTRRRTLLIAEDHPGFAAALLRRLEIDYDVLAVVSTGESLVQHAAILQPDAIVSDVNLEGMNGIEAMQRIHERLPTLPIVFITVGGAAELRPAAVAAGALTVLEKASLEELVGVLRRLWIHT